MQIRWKRVARGHYRNPETGVEIKYGYARGHGHLSSFEAWWIYQPEAGIGHRMNTQPTDWGMTLREVKNREGADDVQALAYSQAVPSFASQWKDWHDYLDDLYPDRRKFLDEGGLKASDK